MPTRPEYQTDPDIDFPVELLIHSIDIQADTETPGLGRAPNWQPLYQGVAALVIPTAEAEPDDFERLGIDVTHLIYVGTLPDGTLPQIGTNNRILWAGTKRPDSKPRSFAIKKVANIGELDIGLVIQAIEKTLR